MKIFEIGCLRVLFYFVAEFVKDGQPHVHRCGEEGWEDRGTEARLYNRMEVQFKPGVQREFYFRIREKNAIDNLVPCVEKPDFIRFEAMRELIAEFQTSKTTKEVFFVKRFFADNRVKLSMEHHQESMIERKTPEPEVIKAEVIVPRRVDKPDHRSWNHDGERNPKPQVKEPRERAPLQTEVISASAPALDADQRRAIEEQCSDPLVTKLDLNGLKKPETVATDDDSLDLKDANTEIIVKPADPTKNPGISIAEAREAASDTPNKPGNGGSKGKKKSFMPTKRGRHAEAQV